MGKPETDYPGLEQQVRALRALGFGDEEIYRAISDRARFLQQTGATGEAIDAHFKGRPSPIGLNFQDKTALETIKAFHKNTTITGDEHAAAIRRLGMGKPSGTQAAISGLIRGITDQLGESGKIAADEIKAGSEMFYEGLKRAAFTPGTGTLFEETAGRGMGVLEMAFGTLRQLNAPITGAVRPFAEKTMAPAIREVVPESVREPASKVGEYIGLPTAEAVSEVALSFAIAGAAGAGRKVKVEPPKTKIATERGPATVIAEVDNGMVKRFHTDLGSDPIVTKGIEEGHVPGEFFRRRVNTIERPEVIVVQETEDVIARTAKEFGEQRAVEAATAAEPVAQSVGAAARRGRPRTRETGEIASGFTDEQARIVAAQRLKRTESLPEGDALAKASGLGIDDARRMAEQELLEFRRSTGELTGKRGRPKEPDALQRGKSREVGGIDVSLEPTITSESPLVSEMLEGTAAPSLRERLRGQKVQLPVQGETGEAFGLSGLRKVADSKGFELQLNSGEKGINYRLVGGGGITKDFDSLAEVNGFLLTKESKVKSAVELKSPMTGESAFEAAVQSKPLTGEQKLNLGKQKAAKSTQDKRPLEGITEEVPRTDVAEAPGTRSISLREGARVGSVEDLSTRAEANAVLQEANRRGFQGRSIKTPDGYEVVFFKDVGPDTIRALTLHSKSLNKGVKALSADEHRFLGRAFGIPDEEVQSFLLDHDLSTGSIPPKPPVAGGSLALTEKLGESIGGGYLRPSPSGAVPGVSPRIRFANPLASGVFSESPVIRGATRDLMHAELAYDHRMKGFKALLDDMAKTIGGGKGTPNAKRAFALKEGTLAPASEADKAFLESANSLTADFARRARAQGMLKEAQILDNYAPHVTDMSAVYDTFRQHIVGAQKYDDLDEMLKVKLTPDRYTHFRDQFLRHPNVATVPKDALRVMKKDLFDFSDVATTIDNLPRFIQDGLPSHLYNRHFLPRGNKAYQVNEDFFQSMEEYIHRTEFNLNFEPILQKYNPILQQMPGHGIPFTERGFIEQLFANAIIKRPTWDTKVVGTLMEMANNKIGREFFQLEDLNASTQLMKSGFLRGALGPDSAIVNFAQNLNTWADTGKFISPMFKFIKTKGQVDTPGVLSEFTRLYGEDAVVDKKFMSKVVEMDRKLTSIVLSPMHLTENINRGIAFHAGLEQAAAKGLNMTDAMKVGFAEASRVVPNLELAAGQLAAIEVVARTQFSGMSATRAPLVSGRGPLGRLSTTLISFPLNQMAFMQQGLRQGFAEAFLKHDPSRLLRYTALTGFWVGLPVVASQMGADMRNMFGPQAMFPLVGFPFFRGVMNGYNAIMGDDPMDLRRARDEFGKFFGTMTIPQFRFGRKAKDVYENIERGFAVDKRGRFLYDTTTYGETMRLFGIGPEKAYDARIVSRELHNLALQYRLDKQDAVDLVLNEGNFDLAFTFLSKWGRPITPQDLQEALMNRMTTPEQRAVQGMPKDIGQQQLMQRGLMPQMNMGGLGGGRQGPLIQRR